jgi:hypothetical protein
MQGQIVARERDGKLLPTFVTPRASGQELSFGDQHQQRTIPFVLDQPIRAEGGCGWAL